MKFTSSPEGATVLINEREVGKTPFDTADLDPSKTHTVIFRKNCYEDATATLMAGSGSQDIKKSLAKKPGCP